MEHSIVIISPPDNVDSVHGLMESVWVDSPEIGMMDRVSFETALVELASNVIRHADAGDGVSCTLTIETTADRIEAILRDTGEPGHVQILDHAMPDEFAESGRGIPLIQALVHELNYVRENDVNTWRIMRKLGS